MQPRFSRSHSLSSISLFFFCFCFLFLTLRGAQVLDRMGIPTRPGKWDSHTTRLFATIPRLPDLYLYTVPYSISSSPGRRWWKISREAFKGRDKKGRQIRKCEESDEREENRGKYNRVDHNVHKHHKPIKNHLHPWVLNVYTPNVWWLLVKFLCLSLRRPAALARPVRWPVSR